MEKRNVIISYLGYEIMGLKNTFNKNKNKNLVKNNSQNFLVKRVCSKVVIKGASKTKISLTGNESISESIRLAFGVSATKNILISGIKSYLKLKPNKDFIFKEEGLLGNVVYNKKINSFYISELSRSVEQKPNIKTLFSFYNKLYLKAKQQKINTIYCDTWIFFQHPLLAKKLGFVVVDNSALKNLEEILKLNNISKIIGYDFKNESLNCKTKDNKNVFFKVNDLEENIIPLWKKEIKKIST